MAKMNWERAAQRSRMYDGVSYSERIELADERWFERQEAREAEREARRVEREQRAAGVALSKKERSALVNVASSMGMSIDRYPEQSIRQLFGFLKADANRLGVDAGVLRRRRLEALRCGHPVTAILKAGKLDGAITVRQLPAPAQRAAAKRKRKPGPPPPVSTKAALKAEAQRSGRAVQDVARSRTRSPEPRVGNPASTASPTPIASRGAGRPPKPSMGSTAPGAARASTSAATSRPAARSASKTQRDRAAAALRGISVEQLKTERREQAKRDQALAGEAKALGITTKELRRRKAEER